MAELEVVRTGSDEWTGAASWSWGEGETGCLRVSAPKLCLPRPPLALLTLRWEVERLTCGAGANTSSRRKAWVGGPGLASRPIAVTITVTTESGAAESGTSSHRLPQADSFGSRQTLSRVTDLLRKSQALNGPEPPGETERRRGGEENLRASRNGQGRGLNSKYLIGCPENRKVGPGGGGEVGGFTWRGWR